MTDFRLPSWYRWLGAAAKPIAQILSSGRMGPWNTQDRHPVWIHAASLGELKGSIQLVRALQAGTPVFLTSTTPSGLRKLRAEMPQHPSTLLPLDESGTVRRFLDSIEPRCVIFLESEAWPAALHALWTRRIPVAFAAFRTDTRALERWRRFGRVFPGWTASVRTVWIDRPNLPEFVAGMGFTDIRPGASLKWAGSTPAEPNPSAQRAAAISIHVRDLPQLRQLYRAHPENGWVWFPRHMSSRRVLIWFARSLRARIVLDPTPAPGEIWIAPRMGLVREQLSSCNLAWVSGGHDTDEPFHCGVPRVLTGSPAVEAAPATADTERTVREILEWISMT